MEITYEENIPWRFRFTGEVPHAKDIAQQISGRTKDHFASENDVCEISQRHKKDCEITSQQPAHFATLRSDLLACGVRLPTCHIYRETLGGIPQHCAKRLRNHFATKGKWTSGSAPKVVDMTVIKNMLPDRFLFASSPYIPDLLMAAKDFKALVLHVFELQYALPKIPHNSP
uniref:Uncharacterized protein n=1 Tax=Vitis vinifera TaxID=29760 RepID=A5AEX3_VITVI|nr:hypothetical protein VITISV_014608 [Vitis vinifera]